MKNKIKKMAERLLMSFGAALMISVVVLGDEFRRAMSNTMNIILGPLTANLPMYIVIFILASITGLYSALIQKYTMDWKFIHEMQERMREFQEEFREARATDNKQKLAKLEEKRAEMMEDQSKMMKQQLKPMFYISVISLPIFFWLYIHVKSNPYLMVFPLVGTVGLNESAIGPLQYWIVWYILCSIAISQIIRKVLDVGGR